MGKDCREYGREMETDQGPAPFVANMPQVAGQNGNFRAAVWTGRNLQWTVMCIPPCGEIGLEIHPETDQLIRVEAGQALVSMGQCRDRLQQRQKLCNGDAVFVPCGTWHNIVNTGKQPLRLSSLYTPPQHPRGTIHRTREAAEKAE